MHVTTSSARTESSAGTNEGRMLAIKQTVVLIINLGNATTLTEARRAGEARHPAGMNAQEMTTQTETQTCSNTITRQPQGQVGGQGAQGMDPHPPP